MMFLALQRSRQLMEDMRPTRRQVACEQRARHGCTARHRTRQFTGNMLLICSRVIRNFSVSSGKWKKPTLSIGFRLPRVRSILTSSTMMLSGRSRASPPE
jgi:hypothetical protein